MADIMQIILWAIPSGSVGAAIAWIANRKVKQAEGAKRVHDTYKVMYEDVSKLLVETQEKYEETTKITDDLVRENRLTRQAVNRLEKAIKAIQLCPNRANCPVRNELSLDADSDEGKPSRGKGGSKGQHRGREKRDTVVVDGAGEGGHGTAGDSA